jgi:NAD(P)-dependent dehydrogenase (short-subunit alcohol dehydrogenase family)
MDSKQKTYLITGAAHGLGRALAEQLNQANNQLILLDKDLKALNKLYDELDEKGWKNIYLFPMDLAGSAQAEFEQLADGLSGFEKLDGLFLNAGILPALTPIEHFDALQWYEVMQTNLNATFFLCQFFGSQMVARQQGKIINIASLLSFSGGITVPSYAASKHAVAGITKALANEWASANVQINAVAPGYFKTDNTQALQDRKSVV